MEYMAGNAVMDRVVEGGLEKDAKVIMKQLLQGTEVIHQEGIVHRDFKPAVSYDANSSLSQP